LRFPRQLTLLLGAKAGSSTGPWGETRCHVHVAMWEVVVMANRWPQTHVSPNFQELLDPHRSCDIHGPKPLWRNISSIVKPRPGLL